MADLASTDVTVTMPLKYIDFIGMGGTGKVNLPSIAFGNGVLKYPANGIPLPAIGAFGMKRAIERLIPTPPPGDGYVYKFDKSHGPNGTIRIYQSAGFTPAGTNANDGPPETFTGTPVPAAPLVELGNVAVVATVLDLTVIGS